MLDNILDKIAGRKIVSVLIDVGREPALDSTDEVLPVPQETIERHPSTDSIADCRQRALANRSVSGTQFHDSQARIIVRTSLELQPGPAAIASQAPLCRSPFPSVHPSHLA